MKRLFFILLVLTMTILVFNGNTLAQTVWTGPKMTFTKTDFADWTLAENQDRITDNVWITRQDEEGIFNIKIEEGYTDALSPEDTEWSYGSAADFESLSFSDWETWHGGEGGGPMRMLNKDVVLHLISDDIYIDIKFLSWTSGGGDDIGNGGGFSYERSTQQLPTVWTGPKMTFTKTDFADWTLAENQDQITDNVWITRQDEEGIFNIKIEEGYTDALSPQDTEWSYGSAADFESLFFSDWETWHGGEGGGPMRMLNKDVVLHLISDDIYIDIKFLSWTSGGGDDIGNGGGFSYERSTPIKSTVSQAPVTTYKMPSYLSTQAIWLLQSNNKNCIGCHNYNKSKLQIGWSLEPYTRIEHLLISEPWWSQPYLPSEWPWLSEPYFVTQWSWW